ncbi:ArsA family ATPase [Blastococcus sp. PRF04-17]|uniref:ArsA family ATPase n=1 Tax=Blastococcus sp. PRF04-17 TaxID=2933797 RepID=UPI001FF10E6B|nr:ArsA-related P-loop ATPase [Blastococcus sp. PRF04-17]UOY02983.1 ion transporter [Blastococcus sp. PRF04-17]
MTGPGGAGTSTLACAAALRAARAGRRTLLLTRQVPQVDDLGTVTGLDVRVVDEQQAVERLWATAAGPVAAALPQLTLPPSSSVVPLPGSAEVAVFAELARADADLVVVDAGPVDAATRLVGLPAALRWWLEQVMPPGMRALAAVRTAAVASGTVRRGPVDAALAAVPAVEGLLAADRMADPTATSVCVVALARRSSVPVLRTAATALGLHGLRTDAVLVRVFPLDGAGEWATARGTEQDAVLGELAGIAPVHQVPEVATMPSDVAGIAALLDGFEPPIPSSPAPPAAERRAGAWQLTVPLPFAERSAVELTRWQDDLVLTAAGTRRSLRLDSLLRRCEVTGGRLADPGTAAARLVVGFRPDPQLWPADLLAAEGRTP